ncbi:hypothetical protein Harman_40980 [Haloarcula mannanilytica]|uniref:fructose-bisphosphatase n=1 Tax=Haloarcula mannanilytica TaxID=2509225 RepID=A0A4C2EU48_9EURY|nr:hypothetical protein Harman_40980 [Haloarcula mannanilytica]
MDYVTKADTETQRRIIERIAENYPYATIVGEEGDELKSAPSDGSAWVIDPIDGTSNFVHDIPFWATTLAAVSDGDTVGGVRCSSKHSGIQLLPGISITLRRWSVGDTPTSRPASSVMCDGGA